MAKKVAKKRTTKQPSTKNPPFPPKFSTKNVRITGFRVEIETPPPIYYESEDRC